MHRPGASADLPAHPSPVVLKPPPTRPPLALFLTVALAAFWRFGYGFGESDHDDFLPELYRMLDPDLYATDVFVQERAGAFSVRVAFLYGLRALCVFMPPPLAVGLVYIGTVLGLSWGVWRLSLLFVPDRLVAFAATLAALVVTPGFTLGGNRLLYSYLVPEGIAWALVVPALILFIQNRRIPAALILGLATWMQPLAGLLSAGALGLVALWDAGAAKENRRGAIWEALRFGVLFGLAAAPMLVPMLLHQLSASGPDGGALSGFYIYAQLRVPHHYLPSAFGLGNAARFVLLLGLGAAGYAVLGRAQSAMPMSFLRRFVMVTAALMGVAMVAILGLESLTAARLQVFKLTVLVTLLATIGAVGGCIALLPAALRTRMEAALDHRVAPVLSGVLLLLSATMVLAGIDQAEHQYRPALHAQSDLGRIEAWARDHTPTDALFAVPPTNATFRVGARRSVVVTWKSFPFQLPRMRAWLDRLQAVAPAPLPPDGRGFSAVLDSAYFANPPAAWPRMAETLGVDFALLDRRQAPTPPAAAPAFESGPWALYPLAP